MTGLIKKIAIAFLFSILGLICYAGLGDLLEDDLGLDKLFTVRGTLTPPNDIVIIGIDEHSFDSIDEPNLSKHWPRKLHAQLIDQLTQAGVRMIVFDIFFKSKRNETEDDNLGKAIKKAGNVLVIANLRRKLKNLEQINPASNQSQLNIEIIEQPIDAISNAVAGSAIFPLPKQVPAKVRFFWNFRASAGDTPALPIVALQLDNMTQYPILYALIKSIDESHINNLPFNQQNIYSNVQLKQIVLELGYLFKKQTGLARTLGKLIAELNITRFPNAAPNKLMALVEAYDSGDFSYINYYGAPFSIETLSYADVLNNKLPSAFSFKNKAVFIGYSEKTQPEQRDGFITVFSDESGLDLSGVEILATAFANLQTRSTITTPPTLVKAAIIMMYGFIIALIVQVLSLRFSLIGTILVSSSFLIICIQLFSQNQLWLPWLIPTAVLTPLVLGFAIYREYFSVNKKHTNIRQAFAHYLPKKIIQQIEQDTQKIGHISETSYAVCMESDASKFTSLAESLQPHVLKQYLNEYFECLFLPVKDSGGYVNDVVGDAMMAVWPTPTEDEQTKNNACIAATKILENLIPPAKKTNLPFMHTRMGLHAGKVCMGNVGAVDHYEYRAIGDVVNTASRIQGLNKQLGTNIIASADVIKGVKGILSRELGEFQLVGKQQNLKLFEILGAHEKVNQSLYELCSQFNTGLQAYRNRQFETALNIFQTTAKHFPNDGPSLYYIKLCHKLMDNNPDSDWDPTITLTQK